MRVRSRLALCAAVSLVSSSIASAVTYEFELQARGNLAANPGPSFNVPHGSTFGSTTVSMNNLGEVASKISTVGTTSDVGIFYGPGDGTGGVAAQANSNDVFWSDVNIGDSGRIIVPQSLSSQDGFYYRDRAQAPGVTFLTAAMGTSPSGFRVLPDNRVLGRTSLGGVTGHRSYNPAGGAVQTYVTQAAGGFSFLASAGPADDGRIASRVFNDAQPGTANDQVRLFSADGSSVLIASEGGSLPGVAGTIASFSNSLTANAAGQVAFVATISGAQHVVVSDGTTTRVVANAAHPLVSVIDAFAPAINANGQVAFRGRDEAGNDAIFFDDGLGSLTRVIGEADTIMTDLGLAQLGQETATLPTFSGGIALNNLGQIAFTTGVYPNGNRTVEWGTAIYVASVVPEPASVVAATAVTAMSLVRRRRPRA